MYSTAASTMMKDIYTLLLLLLLPPVSWGWVDLRTPSYVHVWTSNGTNKWSWKEAQSLCRRNYIDLVTITDPPQCQVMASGAWIGLYRNRTDGEWRWSREDEAAAVTCWNKLIGEPSADRDCAAVGLFKVWFTSSCDEKRTAMCTEERLVLVKEKKSWEEAVEHCRTLETVEQDQSYQLATLWTEDDLAFAREQAEGATTDEVWTGLRHLAGRWLWVAGEQVLLNQLPDCPAESSCGALGIRGSQPIHTSNCELRKNFFCSKKHQVRRVEM